MKPSLRRKGFREYADDEEARKGELKILEEYGSTGSWKDPHFCGGAALYRDWTNPPKGFPVADQVRWERISSSAGRIKGMTKPTLFCAGISSGDVIQGMLGNCWFISALSVVATRPKLLRKIFVSSALANRGIYTLKFYKDGRWIFVHVDDLVPLNRSGTPMFAHGDNKNETWVILVEKAYAKLHGCYENLKRGWIDYGLRDLTGGAPMKIKFLKDKRYAEMLNDGKEGATLFRYLQKSHLDGSLMGCSYSNKGSATEEEEEDQGMGILSGHAYGILRLVELTAARDDSDAEDASDEEAGARETFRLLQLRNPWGMKEWKGDWSDNDVMWDDFPQIKATLIGEDEGFKHDGTFWIDFVDFVEQFNQIFVCVDTKDDWHGVRFNGIWKVSSRGSYPGGCPKFSRSFAQNPQYPFTVHEPTQMTVVVYQRDIRWHDRKMKYENGVGFVLLSLPKGKSRVTHFSNKAMVGKSRSFVPGRHVYTELLRTLSAGRYVLVPCKYSPEEHADDDSNTYGLEVFSDKPIAFECAGGVMIPDNMDDFDDVEGGKEGADDGVSSEQSFDAVQDDHDEPDPEQKNRAMRALRTDVDALAREVWDIKESISRIERNIERELARLRKGPGPAI